MKRIKGKKYYHDFHVEIEKSIAERLFKHCEQMDDKATLVIRRSLRLALIVNRNYQLISRHRRFRCAKFLGYTEIETSFTH